MFYNVITTTVCTFRQKTPTQHALFAEHARSEQYLPIDGSVQEAFDSFYTTALTQLNLYYPERQVSMTSRESSFMTPEVKLMLRRKNKLMRSGRREEAEALAQRIGLEIIESNTAQFRFAGANADAKAMWSKVKQLTVKPRRPRSRRVRRHRGTTKRALCQHIPGQRLHPASQEGDSGTELGATDGMASVLRARSPRTHSDGS